MTHVRFGRSHLHPSGQLTHTRYSDGVPQQDGTASSGWWYSTIVIGALMTIPRSKIQHYQRIYLDRSDPIAFLPLLVDTTVRLYDDFIRFRCFHNHRDASSLTNELPEESDEFRFLRSTYWVNLKSSDDLILAECSPMWISIPLDLSPFISVFHTTTSVLVVLLLI